MQVVERQNRPEIEFKDPASKFESSWRLLFCLGFGVYGEVGLGMKVIAKRGLGRTAHTLDASQL